MFPGLFVVIMVLLTAPLAAHHSLGTYDNTKLIPVTGTVTKVDWMNPHVIVQLSVKGADGKQTTQRVQIAAPGRLTKLGVDKNLFAVGSTMTFETWEQKDSNTRLPLAGRTAVLSNGTRIDVSDTWPMIQR